LNKTAKIINIEPYVVGQLFRLTEKIKPGITFPHELYNFHAHPTIAQLVPRLNPIPIPFEHTPNHQPTSTYIE
jgi:hypothetical protein